MSCTRTLECRTDNHEHDGVWRLLPQRADARTDGVTPWRAALYSYCVCLVGEWVRQSRIALRRYETMASSVLHVKALNFNWSTTSKVGTVDSLCITITTTRTEQQQQEQQVQTRIVPLDTTWCTASGSPNEPEGLPCTSHWVLLCTRLLIVIYIFIMIMHSVLSSLETLVDCSLCLSITISPSTMSMDLESGDYDTRRDTNWRWTHRITDRAIVDCHAQRHRLTLSSSLSPLHATSMRHRCCPSSSFLYRSTP